MKNLPKPILKNSADYHKLKPIFSYGYTLIEMMIVMAIIGILATFFIGNFTQPQKTARDAKRKSDIKQYQTALERQANANNGFYESRKTVVRASTTLCSDLGLTSCPEDTKYPSDNNWYYKYISNGTLGTGDATATVYILWAKLELPTSPVTYFEVCSNGKSGTVTTLPTDSACDL